MSVSILRCMSSSMMSVKQWYSLTKIPARCISECKLFSTKPYRHHQTQVNVCNSTPLYSKSYRLYQPAACKSPIFCLHKSIQPVSSSSGNVHGKSQLVWVRKSPIYCLHKSMQPVSSSSGNVRGKSQLVLSCGLHTTSARFKKKRQHKQVAMKDDDDDDDDIDDFEIDRLLDEEDDLSEALATHPLHGHRVFVLQPDVKHGPKKQVHTNAQLQFEESISLVNTIEDWDVIDGEIYNTKNIEKKRLFGKGTFEVIMDRLKRTKSITAVFVSVEKLTALQHKELEETWHLEVFDRYSVVLQIFKEHARSKEAKLQVALAEIPQLRSRLKRKIANMDQQSGAQQYIGGGGETFLEVQQRVLDDRRKKIQKALNKVKLQRLVMRSNRMKRDVPIIAMVGYTNAGKTTLIKALTGETKMVSKDQLFTTLDVTVHGGHLPNRMHVIYVDTVGFISSLPHDLVASFSATLEDVLLADLIIHVRDISHPDTIAQKLNVIQVLMNIGLPQDLLQNMVEVCNKVDRIGDTPLEDVDAHGVLISATEGTGLDKLQRYVERKIVKVTNTMVCQLKIPQSGEHLSWLYQEGSVQDTKLLEDDDENLLVDVIMSGVAWAKFKSQFGDLRVDAL